MKRYLTFTLIFLLGPFFPVSVAQGQDEDVLLAWGSNQNGQLNVPEPLSGYTLIDGGQQYSLGLRDDGTVEAWGSNSSGQLGIPEPNSGWIDIGAGDFHCLGLKADGSIVPWGWTAYGLGVVPGTNANFVDVACGATHSLGLKANGSIVAWGQNNAGQCSVPSPNSNFVAISAGTHFSVGLKADGSIIYWGGSGYGLPDVPTPNADFVAIAAGHVHCLGLKTDGSIVGWGHNDYGCYNFPSPNEGFVAIAAGNALSLGLKGDGSIIALGRNSSGQTDVPFPNERFEKIGAGFWHSLAKRGGDNNPSSWPENPGPSITLRIEEGANPNSIRFVRLSKLSPSATTDELNNPENEFHYVPVVDGFARITTGDLFSYLGNGEEFSRIDLLSPLMQGHIGFKYTFEDLTEARHVDAYIFLHDDLPLPSAWAGWDYYQPNEYQVSMVVPPEEDVSQIGSPAKSPVVFVHGIGSYFNNCWGEIPDNVDSQVYDCWRFYYPYDQEINKSAQLFDMAIKRILGDASYGLFGSSPYTDRRINVVSHSMGGLVARAYIQGNYYTENIRKLLMFGTPNHGSLLSYRLIYEPSLVADVAEIAFDETDPKSPGHAWMAPSSPFIFNLNLEPPIRLGTADIETDYLVVAGTSDFFPDEQIIINLFHREIHDQDDSVVAVSSASLLDSNIPLALVDINHVHMKLNGSTPGQIETFLDDSAPHDYFSPYVYCYIRSGIPSECSGLNGVDKHAGILELKIPQGLIGSNQDDVPTTHYKVHYDDSDDELVLNLVKNDSVGVGDDNYRLQRLLPSEDYFFSHIYRRVFHPPEIGFWGNEGTYDVRIFHQVECGGLILNHNVASDKNAFEFKHLQTTIKELALQGTSQVAIDAANWRCLWGIFDKGRLSYEFMVDSGIDTLVFSLASEISNDDFTQHDMVLEDPVGRIIDPAVADSDPLLTFSVTSELGPAQYQVLEPIQGLWQVRHGASITSPQVAVFYNADFRASVISLYGNPVEGDTLVCEVIVQGDEICLSTQVQVTSFFTSVDSGDPVSLGDLTMTEISPGVFHGEIPDVAQGQYAFSLTANCDGISGEFFQRTAVVVAGVERSPDDVSGVSDPQIGNSDGSNSPSPFQLFDVSPNPFNSSATISFTVAENEHVELEVYSVSGRRVAILVNHNLDPGFYEVTWTGRDPNGFTLASGVYFLRLNVAGIADTKKVVLLK